MYKRRIPTHLIVSSFSGQIDSKQERELEAWLQSAENQKLYESLGAFYSESKDKFSSFEPDGDYLWNRLQSKVSDTRAHRRSIVLTIASTAAVVLILVSATFFFVRNAQSMGDSLVSIESVSGKSKALLPDGTVVWLNGKSSVEYDKNKFGRRDRSVNLSGEAFFEVEKNDTKPFMVNSGGLTVTVTGTKFNVKETQQEVNVSLKEGSVNLSAPDGQVLSMTAGQKAGYDRASGKLAMSEDGVASEFCWASESLSFRSSSLGNVCKYLSSWYGVTITADPKLHDNFAYTFTVVAEPLEEILRLMAEINPIKYTRLSDGSWLLSSLTE